MNDIIPFREDFPIWNTMRRFEKEFDDFFKTPFFGMVEHRNKSLPKVNIRESKNAYTVDVYITGYNKENIELKFSDGCLHISSKSVNETLDKDETFIHKEISGKAFYRSIPFEKSVNDKKIVAKYSNGILKVELPKSEKEEVKVKNIEIE